MLVAEKIRPKNYSFSPPHLLMEEFYAVVEREKLGEREHWLAIAVGIMLLIEANPLLVSHYVRAARAEGKQDEGVADLVRRVKSGELRAQAEEAIERVSKDTGPTRSLTNLSGPTPQRVRKKS